MELLGGLAIFAGAFVEVVSIPLIVMMLVAMFTVHVKFGFSSVNTIGMTADGPKFGPPGYEINLLYIAGLISLILSSAGAFAIDSLLLRKEAIPKHSNGHEQAARRSHPETTRSERRRCRRDRS